MKHAVRNAELWAPCSGRRWRAAEGPRRGTRVRDVERVEALAGGHVHPVSGEAARGDPGHRHLHAPGPPPVRVEPAYLRAAVEGDPDPALVVHCEAVRDPIRLGD